VTRVRYRFGLGRGGVGAAKYAAAQIDLFAFVALDRREVLYLPAAAVLTGARQADKEFGCQRFAADAPGSLDRFLLDSFLGQQP
jgi:enolase